MAAGGMPADSAPLWKQPDFTCPICLDKFDRHKVLPCGHTFCEDCLQNVAGSSLTFKCSLCRQSVPLPPDGVSNLPDKRFANILELSQIQDPLTLKTGRIEGLSDPYGIAVSDNGLTQRFFVADHDMQNVRVLFCNGASVCHFPTIVPSDDGQKIYPEDISMDGKGNPWVVGSLDRGAAGPGFAVQYNTDGTVLKHFELPRSRYYRGVAVDTKRNHILVTHREGKVLDSPTGAVHVYSPDGERVKTVEQQGMEFPMYVTVDGEGRILVTDDDSRSVYVYNHDGQFLSQFGREILQDPRGICTDSFGNIFVADHGTGHVEMFYRSGKFIRNITTDMIGPQAVAISPQGQLVVVDNMQNELTIFHNCM